MNINEIKNYVKYENYSYVINTNEIEGFDTSTSITQIMDDYDQTIERLGVDSANRLLTILQLTHRDGMVMEKSTGKVGEFSICRDEGVGFSYLGFVPNRKDGSEGKRVTCKINPWMRCDGYVVAELLDEFEVAGERKTPEADQEVIRAELAKIDTSRSIEQLFDELGQAKPNRVRKYNARVQYIFDFFHVGEVIAKNSGKRGVLRFTETDAYHYGYIAFYPYNKDGSVSKRYDSRVCIPCHPLSDESVLDCLDKFSVIE